MSVKFHHRKQSSKMFNTTSMSFKKENSSNFTKKLKTELIEAIHEPRTFSNLSLGFYKTQCKKKKYSARITSAVYPRDKVKASMRVPEPKRDEFNGWETDHMEIEEL